MQKKDILIIESLEQANGGLAGQVAIEHGYFPQVTTWADARTLETNPYDYAGIIVMGGLRSAQESDDVETWVREILKAGTPYLGICYGMQVLAKAVGAEVISADKKELGFRTSYKQNVDDFHSFYLTDAGHNDPLFENIPLTELGQLPHIFQLHSDTIRYDKSCPIRLLATSADQAVPNQIIKVGDKAYGMQNHPEMTTYALNLWLDEPQNFFNMSDMRKNRIREDFRRFSEEYTKISRRLLGNFFETLVDARSSLGELPGRSQSQS